MWRPWDSNDVGQNDENIKNERVHLTTDAKEIINNVFLTLMERGNLCLEKGVELLAYQKTFFHVVKNYATPHFGTQKKRSNIGVRPR